MDDVGAEILRANYDERLKRVGSNLLMAQAILPQDLYDICSSKKQRQPYVSEFRVDLNHLHKGNNVALRVFRVEIQQLCRSKTSRISCLPLSDVYVLQQSTFWTHYRRLSSSEHEIP